MRAPVFILGTGRCGTTLLYRILVTHPDLCVFPTEGNDLWHPLAYPYKQRKIDTPPMEEDAAAFSEHSRNAWPEGHDRRIKRIIAGYHAAHGRDRQFMLQSVMICFYLPTIRQLWPDARFVHLVRNGRAVVQSLTRKNWQKKFADTMSEEDYRLGAAKYWRDSVLAVQEATSQLDLGDNSFLQLRYEELCESPEQFLRQLSEFSGIDVNRFQYDLSAIDNRNKKTAGIADQPEWAPVVDLIRPAMDQYGYAA